MLYFLSSFLLVLLIVATWVVVANLTQWVQTDTNIAFKNHFFLVFLSTISLTSLPLVLSLIIHLVELLSFLLPKRCSLSSTPDHEYDSSRVAISRFQRVICCNFPFHRYPRLEPWRLFALAFPLSVLWIAACSVYYLTISLVDLSTITLLFQINAIFVFLFSWCFLRVDFYLLKAGSLLVSIIGASLVFWARETAGDNKDSSVMNDFLIVLVSLLWALYEVTFCRLVGDVPAPVVVLFLGNSIKIL
jgi:hypothetical protein